MSVAELERRRSQSEGARGRIRQHRGSGLQIVRNVIAPVTRGAGGKVTGYHPEAKPSQIPKAPAVAPSRTIDLTSTRATDKFIRGVLARRAAMREHERYLHRMSPRLAGAAENPGMASRQGAASQPATASVPAVPFDQASKRGIEPGPSFTVTPGAAQVTLGPVGLPAQGYLRAVEIDVATTVAGTGGTQEASEDFPFNLFPVVRFQDTNGNQLDDLPGFALLEDNIWGGYAGSPDPRVDPDFVGGNTASPSFQMMLVRELAPNGFGAIANMSASQAYKLTLRVATGAEWYKKQPATTNPTLTVSTWMHFWQLPDTEDMMRRPQVQTPPFHGTTQYRWYSPENSTNPNFNLSITQTGNEIRNIVLIGRVAGKRSNEAFPEPFQFRWDTELLLIAGLRQLRKIMRELANDLTLGSSVFDAGVVALPFNFGEGRTVGGSGVNSWLPTVTATRLQITGTAPKAALTDVFVNDVSVAETNPALRPATPGPGGYNPPVAPRLAGTQ